MNEGWEGKLHKQSEEFKRIAQQREKQIAKLKEENEGQAKKYKQVIEALKKQKLETKAETDAAYRLME